MKAVVRALGVVVGLGLLLPAPPYVSGVNVAFNMELARSYADHDGVSFLTADSEPLPSSILMTVDGSYGDPNTRIECRESEPKRSNSSSEPVTVLLAISKCLNESALHAIESWVAQIKDQQYSYFQGGEQYDITFATTLVSGACEERSERNKRGLPDDDDVVGLQPEQRLLSGDVLPSDMDRIAAFARFGHVLDALPTTTGEEEDGKGVKDVIPIAVVGFVNSDKSFQEVQRFERAFQISNAFNFQLCGDDTNCADQRFENCIFLRESVDLFLYSALTVTQSLQCDRVLADGIPVTYVDRHGSRQCFCTCPAGYEQQDAGAYVDDDKKACVKTNPKRVACSWNTHPFGFKHEVTKPIKKCAFKKIASKWGIPAPFPSDNYVSDARTNAHDRDKSLVNGPYISVTATNLNFETALDGDKIHKLSLMGDVGLFDTKMPPPGVVDLLDLLAVGDVRHYLTVPAKKSAATDYQVEHVYAWKAYQTDRKAAIDALSFSAYGTYSLELFAQDYSGNATCGGCLAIVDKFRPKATTRCPASIVTKTTYLDSLAKGATEGFTDLTTSNLKKAHNHVLDFFKFGDEAENDACSGSHNAKHSSNRCDETVLTVKDFFETKYADIKTAQAKRFFKPEHAASDLVLALTKKENPLAKGKKHRCAVQNGKPVKDGQCARCAKLSTALKEYWTDYTCGFEYDIRRCEGDADQKCSFEQCLVLNGASLATVRATLKPSVIKESKELGHKSATEIHRELACARIGGRGDECKFKSTLSKLIDTTTSAGSRFSLGEEQHVDEFVFWRYRVKKNGKWKLWKQEGAAKEAQETFTLAKTPVVVEAWTQCGIAQKFAFTVVLHPRVTNYSSYGDYAAALMSAGTSLVDASSEHAGVTVLLATSALVALFALVAVMWVLRRRSPALEEIDKIVLMEDEEDVYHPLLH